MHGKGQTFEPQERLSLSFFSICELLCFKFQVGRLKRRSAILCAFRVPRANALNILPFANEKPTSGKERSIFRIPNWAFS